MKIYLLTKVNFKKSKNLDEYESFIIATYDENKARILAINEEPQSLWMDTNEVSVELIGSTVKTGRYGIILGSFNAA